MPGWSVDLKSVEPSPFVAARARCHTIGGAEGTRTPDLLNAIQTRSQLRHSPRSCFVIEVVMLAGGAEGTRTPDLYSAIVALSQLSYSPPSHLRPTV